MDLLYIYYVVNSLSSVYDLCVPQFSAQESVECNQAYESHYKTPFKIHHAEYPYPEDSNNPSQSSSQTDLPVAAQVKTEQLETCSSPSTVMPLSAATTRQSSPLSIMSSQDGSSLTEVGNYAFHLIQYT